MGVRHTVVGVLLLLLLVSKLILILRASAPVGGGDGVLSKLLLILRVDGTHQKYSSVESLASKVGPTWLASFLT